MLRCNQPAPGKYEVTFRKLHGQYGEAWEAPVGYVDYNAEIGEHGDTFKLFPEGHPRAGEPIRDEDGQPIVIEPGPRVSEAAPYIGELCEHELSWVQQIPGRVYNRNRNYAVRRLDEES